MADTPLRWCPDCRRLYHAQVTPASADADRGRDAVSAHGCGHAGEAWGGGAPPEGFKAGDRVAHRDYPEYCGEIVELVQATPGDPQWLVRWESDRADSTLAQRALVPCYPSEET